MDSPFGRRSLCLLDIETTGFSIDLDEITEIAAIQVNDRFEIVAEMSWLVRISGSVPWRITELTGITDSLLRTKGRPLGGVLDEAREFIGGLPAFAHNASFDRRFLNAFASRTGKAFEFPLECSIPVFKKLLPGRKSYGLPRLVEDMKVDGGGAHRALADCRALLECLQRAHGHPMAS